MLCVWWDCKGIIYKELLHYNEIVNASVYSHQLHNLNLS
jgi:hypothetical protein